MLAAKDHPLRWALPLAATSLLLPACALVGSDEPAAGETDTFAVTFVGPLSGVSADLGTRPADATEVLFDQINSEGGVERPDGQRVQLELTREDTQGSPQGQTLAIRKAARDSDALLGGMLSSPTIAGMDIAESEGIPYNIVGAISATIEEKIQSEDMRFVFHSAPNAAARASADMRSVMDLLSPRNIYVVSQDTDYGRDMVIGAEEYLAENHPDVGVTVEYVSAGTTQYSTQLLKIRDAQPQPDLIYTLLTGQEMFSFMQQKHSTGDNTPVYGGSSTPSSNIYLETLGVEVANGTMTNSVWLPVMAGDRGQKFAQAYENATGRQPADVEAQAYDGALMLIDAIKNAESLNREDIAAALVESEVDGLRGQNAFDSETHGTPGLGFLVTQVQDGTFVPVWPKEYAEGQVRVAG